ncbi:hypothetical protein ABW19_dt0208326 [Dactylella cylindrospora]|nr:hypothetical protein ABW19_dt0208326 [Dactylella cylindrospora]
MSVKRELSSTPPPTSNPDSPKPPSKELVPDIKGPDPGVSISKKTKVEQVSPKTTTKPKSKVKNEFKEGEKPGRGVWTDHQDDVLRSIVTKDQGGNEVRAPWKEIHETFCKKFPDADKTLNSLQIRWRTRLRAGDTDLTVAEVGSSHNFPLTLIEPKILFKQAVADIDGSERALAYAWRFKELGGKDLNKSAATKLYKMLKAGELAGTEDWVC